MTTQGSLSRKKKKFRFTQDTVFDIVVAAALLLIIVIMAYPIYFVFVASFSDPAYVNNGSMLLWPKGFTLLGYQKVFEDARIWIGYGNTLIYTAGGTALGTLVTMMAGYALSRKDLPFRNTLMGYFVFTMYFGGGLIPFYMVIKKLQLTNTRTLMVIISAVAVYNIIITRSFMESNIPEELRDAARVDGCGNGRFFFRIVMPLSKPTIITTIILASLDRWGDVLWPTMVTRGARVRPLAVGINQLYSNTSRHWGDIFAACVILVVPVLILYIFFQKQFVESMATSGIKG